MLRAPSFASHCFPDEDARRRKREIGVERVGETILDLHPPGVSCWDPRRVNPFPSLKAEVPPPRPSAPGPVSSKSPWVERFPDTAKDRGVASYRCVGGWTRRLPWSIPSILALSVCPFYNCPFHQALLCSGGQTGGRAEKETQTEELNSLMKRRRMPDAGPLLGGAGSHWSEQRGPPGYLFSFSASLEVPGSYKVDHVP